MAILQEAVEGMAEHAERIEKIGATPARVRELQQEVDKLRKANRRLQAEGPALERDKLIQALRQDNENLRAEVAALKKELASRPVSISSVIVDGDPRPIQIDATGVDLKGGRGKAAIAIPQATGRPCIHGGIHGRCVRQGCRPA